MTDLTLHKETGHSIKRAVKDSEIMLGDVVGVHRLGGLYDHYGIYTGNGEIIHYADPSGDFGTNIVVHKTTLDAFKENADYLFVIDFDKYIQKNKIKLLDILKPGWINVANLIRLLFLDNNYHLFTPEETVQRAESCLGMGKGQYNIFTKNCEHFAIWCKTGVSESTQVKAFLEAISNIPLLRRV